MDRHLPIIYLRPGEAHFYLNPTRVITVLGSCVSLIMYIPAIMAHPHTLPSSSAREEGSFFKHTLLSRRVGAICHAVMPTLEGLLIRNSFQKDIFQYVYSSIEWMISQFEKTLIKNGDVESKIIGGVDMLIDNDKGTSLIAMGKKNAKVS
jgi:chemotaxis receptor (MCP) glutamine deamidase CheD